LEYSDGSSNLIFIPNEFEFNAAMSVSDTLRKFLLVGGAVGALALSGCSRFVPRAVPNNVDDFTVQAKGAAYNMFWADKLKLIQTHIEKRNYIGARLILSEMERNEKEVGLDTLNRARQDYWDAIFNLALEHAKNRNYAGARYNLGEMLNNPKAVGKDKVEQVRQAIGESMLKIIQGYLANEKYKEAGVVLDEMERANEVTPATVQQARQEYWDAIFNLALKQAENRDYARARYNLNRMLYNKAVSADKIEQVQQAIWNSKLKLIEDQVRNGKYDGARMNYHEMKGNKEVPPATVKQAQQVYLDGLNAGLKEATEKRNSKAARNFLNLITAESRAMTAPGTGGNSMRTADQQRLRNIVDQAIKDKLTPIEDTLSGNDRTVSFNNGTYRLNIEIGDTGSGDIRISLTGDIGTGRQFWHDISVPNDPDVIKELQLTSSDDLNGYQTKPVQELLNIVAKRANEAMLNYSQAVDSLRDALKDNPDALQRLAEVPPNIQGLIDFVSGLLIKDSESRQLKEVFVGLVSFNSINKNLEGLTRDLTFASATSFGRPAPFRVVPITNLRIFLGIDPKGDQAALAQAPGGIDLNADNLNLKIRRDGKGVPLPLAQQDWAQLNEIQGFLPTIIEIKPAGAIPILSEIKQKLQTAPLAGVS
jgi:hypothetical protein